MNAIVPANASGVEHYRQSTDAAGLCRDIVLKTAQNIQGRKYVKVEGWQALAIAHGCAASADHVERVEDEGMSGFKAIGIVRRMSDGAEIARAEGFLGDDETMWAKRPVYARRAMVQTRAISRACRSAFAHVVVLIDANLSTTPAEEVPDEGFDDRPPRNVTPQRQAARKAEPSAIFTACKAAIDICEDEAELNNWTDKNTKSFEAMSDADYKAVCDYWNVRLRQVRSGSHKSPDNQDLTDADLMEMAQ